MFDKLSSCLIALKQAFTLAVTMFDKLSSCLIALKQAFTLAVTAIQQTPAWPKQASK
jgi:hypothetical protein